MSAGTADGPACNTLTVPGFLGAIPRPPRRRGGCQHASSTESDSAANTELSTPSGSTAAEPGTAAAAGEERRCFCGYYSEVSLARGLRRWEEDFDSFFCRPNDLPSIESPLK